MNYPPQSNKGRISFKFERLTVWQKSMKWGEEIFTISKKFPKTEMYNLSSQILRAPDSVALNIAEGSILQSDKEFIRFLGYSIRSIAEIVTCLHKAKARDYINEKEFQANYKNAFDLMNMLIAFQKRLK